MHISIDAVAGLVVRGWVAYALVAINGDPTAVWRGFRRVRIDAHLLR